MLYTLNCCSQSHASLKRESMRTAPNRVYNSAPSVSGCVQAYERLYNVFFFYYLLSHTIAGITCDSQIAQLLKAVVIRTM